MGKRLTTFSILLVTQSFSLLGSRMTEIAVGIWVFNQTGNVTPLLLASFFAELPGMLGGSLAGVLVDRWDRRRVMMLSDSGQAFGSLLLLFSFLSGDFQIWQLYLVSLLQGVFATFQGPAQSAVITMLVGEAHRERANGIQEMAFPLAGVVAPVLTGVVYAGLGVSGVITVDLATFLLAVGVVFLLRIPHPKPTQEGLALQGGILREAFGALRFLRLRRGLLRLILYMTLMNFMLNGPLELAIPYLISITGSETLMGGIMGVMSLGALAGAGLIALFGGFRPRMPLLLGGLLLTGLMFLVYGAARSPLLLSASLFFLMAPLPSSWALQNAILQVKTPPDMQGRMFALVSQLGFLGSTLSFLLTGPLVDRVLKPAASSPAWSRLTPLLGSGDAAGMGLLLLATGVIILLATLGVEASHEVRHLEAHLPDYAALVVESVQD
jgi:DHA3 family macrolide efflux protein-like MFS transporter